jgi:membrane-associated PAP2 superfamily phosphatase
MHASKRFLAGASLAAFLALLLWDASGLDLRLALAVGGPAGFPLREHWFLTQVMHAGAKWLGWLLALALSLSVTWPVGPLHRLPLRRRVQLAATPFLASGVIALLKASSHTSCPWDLVEFGGAAHHVSHWLGLLLADGGSGGCFPAGHASTGFAFLGGYFALRDDFPRAARRWLLVALAAGLALGISQQLRGAHFMSHTLWSGWICWMLVWITDPVFARAGRLAWAEVDATRA